MQHYSKDYESPIHLVMTDVQTKIEDNIIKAVQGTGIEISKSELVKALKNDRDSYDKGLANGKESCKEVFEVISYLSKNYENITSGQLFEIKQILNIDSDNYYANGF